MALDRHVNKLYKNLSHKAEASVLIQMRTEKIGYLNKIIRSSGIFDSFDLFLYLFSAGAEPEARDHICSLVLYSASA